MEKKGSQSGKIVYKGNGSNVKFKNKEYNFTMVSNIAIRDPKLSLKAKGLYSLIQSYITIPGYQLYKSYLYSICSEGERAFDSAWKELQTAGYFTMTKKRDENNRFFYEYELLDEPIKKTPPLQNVGMENSPGVHFAGMENEDLQNPTIGNSPSIIKDSKENFEINILNNKTFYLSENKKEGQGSSINDLENSILDNSVMEKYSYNHLAQFVEFQMQFDQYLEEISNDMKYNMRLTFAENVKEILIDFYAHEEKTFTIGKTEYKTALIKPRLLKLSSNVIRNVVDELTNKTTSVKNISVYIQTMLINAHLNQSMFNSALKDFD